MPDKLLKKMLVVVDGSDASMAAVDYAVGLARQVGAALQAVYVVDTATMDYLLQMHIFVSDERREFEKELESTGARYLEYVKTAARKAGLEVTTHLARGAFHKTVLALAREVGADAIVLGGWCETVTRRDVMAGERRRVLEQAACPLIVVRCEDKRG